MVQRNSQPCLRSASLNIYFGSDVGKLYTDGIQATTAHQQEQIEALAAGFGRTIWITDAYRGDGKRFVVHADDKPTAFLELESAIRVATGGGCDTAWSDDTCPKSPVEEIMYLRNQP
jgi:hypothetical protein